MDIRVKRASQLSLALDVISIAIAAVAAVTLTMALQATGYLFLLPFALLFCLVPVVAGLLDWLIVQAKTKAGKNSFVWYYLIITRLILLSALLYGYYSTYIGSPLEGKGMLWLYTAGFGAVLATGIGSVTLLSKVLGKGRTVEYGFFMTMALIMTGGLGYLIYVMNFSPSSPLPGRGIRSDKQTVYDIYLLRQDVWSYYIEEKKLPDTLKQALSKPQSYGTAIPADRLRTYEYKPGADGRQYDICAHFSTDTSAKNFPNSPEESHKAGYYCVHYDNR